MQRSRRTLVAIGLLVVGLQLAACTQQSAAGDGATNEPATVEHIEGSEVRRLTLTAKAAERLGIRTKPVLAGEIGGAPRRVVPYSAVLYDANGDTWVYANLEPLAYVRERVTVAMMRWVVGSTLRFWFLVVDHNRATVTGRG